MSCSLTMKSKGIQFKLPIEAFRMGMVFQEKRSIHIHTNTSVSSFAQFRE